MCGIQNFDLYALKCHPFKHGILLAPQNSFTDSNQSCINLSAPPKKRSPYCLSRGVILHPVLQPLCGSLAQSLWAYCRDIRPGWHKSSHRQQFLLTQHRAEMDGAAWVCRTHPQSRTEKSLGFLAAERWFFFRHCNILLKLYSRDVIPLNHVSKHLWR